MLTKYVERLGSENEVYLRIKARPGAASTEVRGILEGEDGETVKIDVAAAPEQGKGNTELIKYLSVWFQVPKSNIMIISGAGDKVKLVKITK